MLTVDNDLFNTHIGISNCVNIIPIKIEKRLDDLDEDTELALAYTSDPPYKSIDIRTK